MTDTNSDVPTDAIAPQAARTPARTPALTLSWGSGGEAHIAQSDMDRIADMVDGVSNGDYRSVFPVHGQWGTLVLDANRSTVWLHAKGAHYIAGELVDPTTARPRSLPASGVVNIGTLDPKVQEAVMTILRAQSAKRQ